jgi:hypothetical protein
MQQTQLSECFLLPNLMPDADGSVCEPLSTSQSSLYTLSYKSTYALPSPLTPVPMKCPTNSLPGSVPMPKPTISIKKITRKKPATTAFRAQLFGGAVPTPTSSPSQSLGDGIVGLDSFVADAVVDEAQSGDGVAENLETGYHGPPD